MANRGPLLAKRPLSPSPAAGAGAHPQPPPRLPSLARSPARPRHTLHTLRLPQLPAVRTAPPSSRGAGATALPRPPLTAARTPARTPPRAPGLPKLPAGLLAARPQAAQPPSSATAATGRLAPPHPRSATALQLAASAGRASGAATIAARHAQDLEARKTAGGTVGETEPLSEETPWEDAPGEVEEDTGTQLSQLGPAQPAAAAARTGLAAGPMPPEAPSPHPRMLWRLRDHSGFWKTFNTSPVVERWLMEGVDIIWSRGHSPLPSWLQNHPSAHAEAAFVDTAVAELVATGAARACSFVPHVVSPLGVAVREETGKKRLILDARYLNEHVYCPKFRYESLDQLHEILLPGDFISTSDAKAGFHHITMHPDTWTYLGFAWRGQCYHFTQLPFGLKLAPWVYTKVTRQLLQKWRSEGMRVTIYMDDNLYAASGEEASLRTQAQAQADLQAAGFLLSDKKCQWGELQRLEYLGTIIDTAKGVMEVPQAKRDRLLCLLERALTQRKVQIRMLARIAGQLTAMRHAFGPLTRMYTKGLTFQIATSGSVPDRPAYRRWMPLSAEAHADLQFWQGNFDTYNGSVPIWRPAASHTIFTDAAGKCADNIGGWGGWRLNRKGERLEAAGRWQESESDVTAGVSSTYMEILAVLYVLRAFNARAELEGSEVLLMMDNQAATHIINKGGSGKPLLNQLCKELFWWAYRRGIGLRAQWVPREENELADHLSKMTDDDSLMLSVPTFRRLHAVYGPFHTDLFASHTDKQLPRFFSKLYSPGAAGVDAFGHPWPHISWAHPPYALVGKVVRHALARGVTVGLLVPRWPSAKWWHELVTPGGRVFKPFVHACERIPARPGLLGPGWAGQRVPKAAAGWDMLFLLLVCSPTAAQRRVHVPGS